MVNQNNILETINMIKLHHLDIRTVTMSLSLRDCISDCQEYVLDKVYKKITTSERLSTSSTSTTAPTTEGWWSTTPAPLVSVTWATSNL